MLHNMLLDPLPKNTPNGFKIDTNFRTSIKFELLMQDNKVSEKDKVLLALNLYYDLSEIDDMNKAIEDMLWFYRCGKEEKNRELANSNNTNNKKEQIYSYEFDAEYIYPAFFNQYNGLDLNEIKYLHWWKFKAMFESLKEDNQIVKIMGYRAIDLSKIKDKETKERYKKLKKAYKLPDMRTEEEKQCDFGNAFW